MNQLPALVVISDTHGAIENLKAVVQWVTKDANKRKGTRLVFLGDGVKDFKQVLTEGHYTIPYHVVRGNCDADFSIPFTEIIEFEQTRFFICHGHSFSVHDDLSILLSTVSSLDVQGILFGHTHRPFWEEIDHKLFLNPGSLGRPHGSPVPTFATIQCPPDKWFIIRYWMIQKSPWGTNSIKAL